jgi:plastocyanin
MNALLLATALIALSSGDATTSSATQTVHIRAFAFVPARLTVRPGTVVKFVNDDAEAHTVTAKDRSFDSQGLDTGEAWGYRFATTGTFAYFCALHPYMRGTIVVTP